MASTLPPIVSLADSAIGRRASGLGWANAAAQQRPSVDGTVPPSAADSLDAAVVNHVHAAGSTETEAEPAVDAAGKKSAPNQSSAEQSDEAKDEIRELKKRDADVRAHEQAHAAAGGAFAGAPSYELRRGPDGRSYAVSGEVPIDVSPVSGNPEATIIKMQQVKRAALAPQEPSGADRAIAATADAMILAAQRELNTEAAKKITGAEPTQDAESAAPAGNGSSAGQAAREAFSMFERRSASANGYAPARAASALDLVS